jgi:hypothetical protein
LLDAVGLGDEEQRGLAQVRESPVGQRRPEEVESEREREALQVPSRFDEGAEAALTIIGK